MMGIRRSMGRFISIMLIVALGVAFYSGIKASEPDIRLSLDQYYDRTKLLDIRVQGTLGLTDDDLDAIRALDGVQTAEPAKTVDVLYDLNDSQDVLHFSTMGTDMDLVEATEGTLPTKENECALDASFAEHNGIKVGDKLTVYLDPDSTSTTNSSDKEDNPEDKTEDSDDILSESTDILDTLATDTFTVTALASSPMYVSFSRGSSQVGQGEVNAFVFVPESAFVTDVYTEINIIAEGSAEQTAYTTGYDDIVATLEDTVKGIEDERNDARYDETAGDAQRKIDDAKEEISDNLLTLEDNRIKLLDSQKEIDDSTKELEDSAKELEDNKAAYESGKTEADSQLAAALDKLNSSQAQLDAEEQQLANVKLLIDAGQTDYQAQYDAGMAALEQGRTELQSGYDSYYSQKASTEAELAENESKLDDAEKKLADGKKKIEDGQKEIDDGWAEIYDGYEEIAEGRVEILNNQLKVNDIEYPEWYVTDRDDLPQYTQCGDNADSVGAIGNVFPVIFFLVAALISLTTMTRMVEEERSQIGILSALGYRKPTIIGQYLLYAALATCFGCIAGVFIGEKIFPFVIVYSYQIMTPYATDIVIPYMADFGIAASVAALACTMVATLWACFSELTSKPAALMRPVPPQNGKRILLERITPFWKRLSFSNKSTFRNLFRYKKRFLMTVLGIGGCMGIMLVGFGIKNSIEEIADLQYGEIQHYQGTIIYDDDSAKKELDRYLKSFDTSQIGSSTEESGKNNSSGTDEAATTEANGTNNGSGSDGALSYGTISLESVDGSGDGSDRSYSCYIFVPQDQAEISDFVTLRTRKGHEPLTLSDDGAIVTEKIASMLDLSVGDYITLTKDNKDYKVKISAITEQYLYHYVYMTDSCYKATFGKEPDYNAVVYKTSSSKESEYKQVGEGALGIDGVVRVSYASATRSQLDSMLSALDLVIVVLVVAAGMLAFVVIFNLNNININERKRELATLKVLGFHDMEVAMYIYRENIWLTLDGCIAGCFIGNLLHRFIITTVEIDTCMFGRSIAPESYVYCAVLTALFAVIVNVIMFFKLRKIDMIESLKSAE